MHVRKKPEPAPTSAPVSGNPESGTRPRASGVLRLVPTRDDLMFDEVFVFPNGAALIALEGEPLLRYPSLESMLRAYKLEPHELRAAHDHDDDEHS